MDCTEKKIKSNLNVALEQTAYNLSTIQPKRSKLLYKVWLYDYGQKIALQPDLFKLRYGPTIDEYIEIPFFEKKKIYFYIGSLKNKKIDMGPISKWINLNYDNLIKFYKQEEDYDFLDFMFDMLPEK